MSITNGHENSLFNLLVSSKARREIVSVHRDLPIRQALEPLLKKWGLSSNKVTIQLRYYQHTLTAETLAGDAEGTEIYVWKQSDPGDKALKGFHPFINKASLKNCTQPYIGRDGWYLARESSSANGQFSLAVTFENQLRHFKINFSPHDGMYKVASKGFENLHELFAYYTIHSIKRTAEGDIFLSHPIPQEGKPENNPPAPKPENNLPPPPPPKHEKNSCSSIQSLPVTAERDLSPNNAHSKRPLPPLPGAPSIPPVNNKPHFQPKAPVHKPENIQPIQDHPINRTPVAAAKPSAVNIFKNRKNSNTLPRPGRKASGDRPLPPLPPPDEGPGMSFPNSLTNPLISPTPQIPSIKDKQPAIASKLFPQPSTITKNDPKNRSYNDLNKPSSDQSSEKQSNHGYPSQSPSSFYPIPQLPHTNSNSSNSSNNEKEAPTPLLPKGPATPSNPIDTRSNSSNSNYYPSDPKQESQQAMNGSSTPVVSHANDPPSDDTLPPNWVRVYSKSRAKFYYFNQVSSETKWSHPLLGKEAASKQSNGLVDMGRSVSPSEAGRDQLVRERSFSEAKKPKRQSPPLLNQKPSPVEKRCDKIQNRNGDFQSSSRLVYSPEPSSPLEKTRNRTQSFRSKENNAHVYDHLPGSESQPPPASNNVQPRHSVQHTRQAPPIPVLSSPPLTIMNGLPAPNRKQQQQPGKHSPHLPSKHFASVDSAPSASVPRGKPVQVGKHTIPAPPPDIPKPLATRAASLPADCTNPRQVGKSTTLPSRVDLFDQIKKSKTLRPVSDSERPPREPIRPGGTMLSAISNVLEHRKQMIQDSDESDYEDADDEW